MIREELLEEDFQSLFEMTENIGTRNEFPDLYQIISIIYRGRPGQKRLKDEREKKFKYIKFDNKSQMKDYFFSILKYLEQNIYNRVIKLTVLAIDWTIYTNHNLLEIFE